MNRGDFPLYTRRFPISIENFFMLWEISPECRDISQKQGGSPLIRGLCPLITPSYPCGGLPFVENMPGYTEKSYFLVQKVAKKHPRGAPNLWFYLYRGR